MQIAVVTVKRNPSYIKKTLESMGVIQVHSTLQADLFVGSPDISDVIPLARANLKRFVMPSQIWNHVQHLKTYQRAIANFVQALRSQDGDLMLFEDDIELKPGWAKTLAQYRTSIQQRGLITPMLSLYAHPNVAKWIDQTPGAQIIADSLGYVVLTKPIVFHGTVALFIPGEVRGRLAAYAEPLINYTQERVPFDEIIKRFVDEHHGIRLAVTVPSLVNHVGEVSAIEENAKLGLRRSPLF